MDPGIWPYAAIPGHMRPYLAICGHDRYLAICGHDRYLAMSCTWPYPAIRGTWPYPAIRGTWHGLERSWHGLERSWHGLERSWPCTRSYVPGGVVLVYHGLCTWRRSSWVLLSRVLLMAILDDVRVKWTSDRALQGPYRVV